jgi:EutQ-like cupin domain
MIEGEIVITPDGGKPVTVKGGDAFVIEKDVGDNPARPLDPPAPSGGAPAASLVPMLLPTPGLF